MHDYIIAFVQIWFVCALGPSMGYTAMKPERFTSWSTAAGLYVMSLTCASLGLVYTFATMFAAATCWFIIYGRTK